MPRLGHRHQDVPDQSEQLYVSVRKQGVDTKLVVYRNEHHNVGGRDWWNSKGAGSIFEGRGTAARSATQVTARAGEFRAVAQRPVADAGADQAGREDVEDQL